MFFLKIHMLNLIIQHQSLKMHLFLGILCTGFIVADSYKILVYSPTFGHSHSNYMGRIADILAEAGHNVVSSTNIWGDR